MKENDEKKLLDSTCSISEDKVAKEQTRNTELWTAGKTPSTEQSREKSSDRFMDQSGSDLRKLEVPDSGKINAMIDKAWENRESSGRFDTEGKSAILWSGYASSSEHRKESTGSDGPLYSKDLAENHASKNPDSHITLGQTVGGKELEKIQSWIDSDTINPSDREALNQRMGTLWNDASERFADSAKKNESSIAYVEHAREQSVYKQTERETLDTAKDHRHFTDKPLVDGRPPVDDKLLPGDLDKEGRYYKA